MEAIKVRMDEEWIQVCKGLYLHFWFTRVIGYEGLTCVVVVSKFMAHERIWKNQHGKLCIGFFKGSNKRIVFDDAFFKALQLEKYQEQIMDIIGFLYDDKYVQHRTAKKNGKSAPIVATKVKPDQSEFTPAEIRKMKAWDYT